MRPNVSQSYWTHQSGACNLMDEIKPASEASTSQTTARVKHTPTTRDVERSALARASASTAAMPRPEPAPIPIACCKPPFCAEVAAGSSAVPSSFGAKICVAAAVPSPNNPLDIDQMKANSAAMDSKKVPSKRLTVKSIRWRPPLRLRSQLHAAPQRLRVISGRLCVRRIRIEMRPVHRARRLRVQAAKCSIAVLTATLVVLSGCARLQRQSSHDAAGLL